MIWGAWREKLPAKEWVTPTITATSPALSDSTSSLLQLLLKQVNNPLLLIHRVTRRSQAGEKAQPAEKACGPEKCSCQCSSVHLAQSKELSLGAQLPTGLEHGMAWL